MFFGVILPTLLVGAAQPPSYEWKQHESRFIAAEEDRIVELVQVGVRESNDAFASWSTVFVEPCAARNRGGGERNPLPCWPEDESERTQELLGQLARGFPEYRTGNLLHPAQYLNRDLGTFRRAWIVGTNPLAVAYLEGPPDQVPSDVQPRVEQMKTMRTRPTTRPGFYEIITRTGEVVPLDLRVRDARFVTKEDLDETANVVLLFPEGMPLRAAGIAPPLGAEVPPLKVIHLTGPMSLDAIMKGLIDRDRKLERDAEKVEAVPVALHP